MNKVLLMALAVGMLTTCTDSKQTKTEKIVLPISCFVS